MRNCWNGADSCEWNLIPLHDDGKRYSGSRPGDVLQDAQTLAEPQAIYALLIQS
ncbi:hypothetical protein [Paenibacillus sp. OSY-SE]|uniref:hypothetical protein n=1 Tax=Paenibacillus sp. OSY-SE TaxID=1196323 RepID=UPI0003124B81|nr:hypothetical protein [Paenibacillus sp. OSY-SE]